MPHRRNILPFLLILCLAAGAVFSALGQVLVHPRLSDSLRVRFDWGIQEAEVRGFKKGFWVGYSIRRLMGERSFIGGCSSGRGWVSLEELVYGKRTASEKRITDDQAVRDAAKRALLAAEESRRPEKLVLKEIGILLKFTASKKLEPQRAVISNMTLSAGLEGLPLLWLGPADDADSLLLLQNFYDKASVEKAREALIQAVSIHRNAPLVVPFLERILNGREPESVKADAAVFLGEQNDGRALEVLRKTIRSHPLLEVRKNAVWGLNEMDLPAAADTLIDLALHSSEKAIRSEAVQGLADKASKEAAGALEKIAFDDKETEVQKEAVRAFSDLPAKDGLPYLIRIAKTHANPEIRKEAVYALGDIDDPRAVQTLIEIVKGIK